MRGTFVQPKGLDYRADFITSGEEQQLLAWAKTLNLTPMVMREQASRRLTRHFGVGYSFLHHTLTPARQPIPLILEPFARRAEEFARLATGSIIEALVTRYPRGAPIGWHSDAGPFGVVVGISLLNPVVMQFQNIESDERLVYERIVNPRSAYVMSGEARYPWQHHIPPTKVERYSITFRTLS